MQSRFTIPTPAQVTAASSLPRVSDRLASVSLAAPRCAAYNQTGKDGVTAVDNNAKLSLPARLWIQKTKRLKDMLMSKKINSVRARRRSQGYSADIGGVQGRGHVGRLSRKAQAHASVVLRPLSNIPVDPILEDVLDHVPSLSELQALVQDKASRVWCSYQQALQDHPLRTKALTSCVGLTIADMIAQAAAGGGWDILRTSKLASFGMLWHGVSAHVWYQLLDKHVMPEKSSSSKAIVTKMMLDQAIWAPLNTALFYAYLALADGKLSSLPDTLQAKLLPTILAGYALWPVAHVINFKYIPSSQRLLYINVVNLFWTVYLSGMANSAIAVDPVHTQVQRFGVAIPVSLNTTISPPVVAPPAAPTVVHV